jgi:predicted DNA-binding protein with PD1-like motif
VKVKRAVLGGQGYVIRVETGEDLLETLQRFVTDEGIRYAAIVSAIGSASSWRLHVVASAEIPPREAFPEGEGAVDICHMQGYVLDGRVHAHVTFADARTAFGGHLERGVRVLTFAVITLIVLPDDLGIAAWDRL